MTSTLDELYCQAKFLCMGYKLSVRLMKDPQLLKKYMIRHTKAQRINGSSALSLPKSTTTVKLIEMSVAERQAYQKIVNDRQSAHKRLKAYAQGVGFFSLATQIFYPLTNPLLTPQSSKIKALENSLVGLLQRDSNMRAVVFTQHREQLSHITAMVKQRLDIGLYSFDGSTTSLKRDAAIRSFQSVATSGPAVFVVTLLTGSVGITLSAAAHIFLMEPCLNPSEEVQAAGRINRLGQNKEVQGMYTRFLIGFRWYC